MSIANTASAGHHIEHHHAHHFESEEHQYESSKQGIWLFMATEILMFGGLFVAYLIYKSLYPQVWHEGSKLLNVSFGATNTVVLITSSLTMALAIYYIQLNRRFLAILCLGITIACALTFMVIKYFEYSHKIHVGTVPGKFALVDNSNPASKTRIAALVEESVGKSDKELREEHGVSLAEIDHLSRLKDVHNWQLFLGFYFVMTGLHGLHVIIGACLIFWLLLRTINGEFGPDYYTPVEGVGIFWHIVDLIWIYLFPLFYLVG
ncbi:MAG: cytochrome c oxidase subunit 3 family protein [Leptospira sp.]|nr:cytochrome c oxidase subunit 3 family protein [Leptospira sp.]